MVDVKLVRAELGATIQAGKITQEMLIEFQIVGQDVIQGLTVPLTDILAKGLAKALEEQCKKAGIIGENETLNIVTE